MNTPLERARVLKNWRGLVRVNGDLRRLQRALPMRSRSDAIKPAIFTLQVRIGLCLKLAVDQPVAELLAQLHAQLESLLSMLDHRSRQLQWQPSSSSKPLPKGILMQSSLMYLRDEISRQISLTVRLLEEIRDTTSGIHKNTPLVKEAEADTARHFDRADLERVVAMFKDELIKVERFEYRVMLLGTVKAGKTTTVVGLTGDDVLPTRTEASTALPTLLRNEPGNSEPTLFVRRADVLRDFFTKIRTGTLNVPDPASDPIPPGVKASLNDILAGKTIPPMPVSGTAAVRDTISLLNDGLRLAERTGHGMHFMEAFQSSDDLPVVDVAFSSLAGVTAEGQFGQVVLVDSPGPNEAAHSERLLGIVKHQISRASALVVVTNYITLLSSDENNMRSLVSESAAITDRARNILLLNRFDQRKAGDPTPDEMKEQLARRYPEFQKNRIFAVSAERAAKSTRVLRSLDKTGEIADPLLAQDFGEIAFGMSYSSEDPECRDPKILRQMVPKVWGHSFFDSVPQKNGFRAAQADETTFLSCIRELVRNAAHHCIGSALQVLSSNTSRAHAVLTLRSQLEQEELAGLYAESDRISRDIQELDAQKVGLDQLIENAKSKLDDAVDTLCDELTEHVKSQLNCVFTKEQRVTAPPPPPADIFSRMFSIFSSKQPRRREAQADEEALLVYEDLELDGSFAPSHSDNIKHSSPEAAKKFQEDLESKVTVFVGNACVVCQQKIGAAIDGLAKGVQEHVESTMNVTLAKASERLGEAIPTKLTLELNESVGTAAEAGIGARAEAATHHHHRTEYRDKQGGTAEVSRIAAGWVSSVFGVERPTWGKYAVEVTDTTYEISAKRLTEIHLKRVEDFQEALKKKVEQYSATLNPLVDGYHKGIARYLEAYKNTISDTLADHTLSAEERVSLRDKVLSLRERVYQLLQDVSEAMEVHLGKRQVST
jgi:GTPase SAR1 family protein